MIPVTKSYIPPLAEYNKYLEKIWENVWLTNRGELVQTLEQQLKSKLEIPNLLFVNNGTIALQIAIKALGLKGEIITTPFSYVATTSSIVWEGCQPIFVDIDKTTLCIDADLIENAITEKTTAILATHVYGIPCDVEKIEKIAKKHNLKVIYDAAHCFGVNYKGQSLLNYGDISTLSFHATKLFHTGEGGAIVAPNKELFDKIYYMHNFGHNGQEDFFGVGINGKSSELHAAMGLTVLPYVDEIIAKRKFLCQEYDRLLQNTDILKPQFPLGTEPNYSYYPVLFPSEKFLLDVKQELNQNEIFPRRYFYPSLNNLPYLNYQSCPVSEQMATRVLCLPLYYELEQENVIQISTLIKTKLK